MPEPDVVARIRAFALQELREEYPYMISGDLDSLVKKTESCVRGGIEEREPAMKASKQRASFFMLPRELRDYVYELAVTFPHKLEVISLHQRCAIMPTLLRASSQLREEALPIFYSKNAFQADYYWVNPRWFEREGLTSLRHWLDVVGSDFCRSIKSLEVIVHPNKAAPFRFADAICKLTGATRASLHADSREGRLFKNWNNAIVGRALGLDNLVLPASAIRLIFSNTADKP